MRNSPIEILVIGCGTALGVLLVHMLTEGASALIQLLALLSAGVVLFCIQLALVLRRAGRGDQPQQDQPQQPPRLLRRRRGNPFVRELTHDWIGLEDHVPEPDTPGPRVPDALDDELWGEPPQAPLQNAAVQKADDSRQQ